MMFIPVDLTPFKSIVPNRLYSQRFFDDLLNITVFVLILINRFHKKGNFCGITLKRIGVVVRMDRIHV